MQLADQEWHAWVSASQLAAELLECWPTVSSREARLQLIRPRLRQAPRRELPAEQHRFIAAGRHRICERCLFRAKSPKGEQQAMWRTCPGSARVIGQILQSNGYLTKPHQLILFVAGGKPGLVCSCCGCHASTMQHNLGFSCLTKPTKKGKECLARVGKGKHPHLREGKLRMEACWEVDDEGGLQ